MKVSVFILLLFFSSVANSAVQTVTSKVDLIGTYSTYGDGDVVFQLDDELSGCEGGLWLRKSDPGFDSHLNLLLSAFHANTKLTIGAHTDQLWSGSTKKYCRVDWIKLLRK